MRISESCAGDVKLPRGEESRDGIPKNCVAAERLTAVRLIVMGALLMTAPVGYTRRFLLA